MRVKWLRKPSRPTFFVQDGIQTKNLASFRHLPEFQELKRGLIETIGLDYGMDWRTHIFIELGAYAAKLEGDFVELGCGEGWMLNALLLDNPTLPMGRKIFGFDKFNGQQVDMSSGGDLGEIHPRYPQDLKSFQSRLVVADAVEVYQSHLPEGLDVLAGRQIAFLHIDLNSASPEIESFERLYEQVVPGGVVIFDDFGGRGRSTQNLATRQLSKKMNFRILELPTGQGIVFKSPR